MQYSKIWPIVSTSIFGLVILFAFFGNFSDSTVILGALTASGSVALTTIVFYMKNSWMEKVSRVKIDVAKTMSETRLDYNKQMLLFLKENHLTKEDLDMVEQDSFMDELDNNTTDNLTSSIDSDLDEAATSPESITI